MGFTSKCFHFLIANLCCLSMAYAIPASITPNAKAEAESVLRVENSISPSANYISDNQGDRRPISRIQLTGMHFDFVNNEVVINSRNIYQVREFTNRWNGQITKTLPSQQPGGLNSYVIKIDPNQRDLPEYKHMLAETSQLNSQILVSDQAGLRLIGIILDEKSKGLRIGLSMDMYIYSASGEPEVIDFEALVSSNRADHQFGDIRF